MDSKSVLTVQTRAAARGGTWGNFHNVGATLDRRYCAGQLTGTLATQALTANTIVALPYYSGRGGTIDRLGVNVSTLGASSSIRCAIYNVTSDSNLYPSSLVIDGGAISSASTGVKEATISQALSADTLYWFCVNCNATAPTLSSQAQAGVMDFMGLSASYTQPSVGWSVGLTFAAYPSTFTAGGTVIQNTNCPLIGVRYSA